VLGDSVAVGGTCPQCAEDQEVECTLQEVYARGRLAFHCVTSLHYHCVACLLNLRARPHVGISAFDEPGATVHLTGLSARRRSGRDGRRPGTPRDSVAPIRCGVRPRLFLKFEPVLVGPWLRPVLLVGCPGHRGGRPCRQGKRSRAPNRIAHRATDWRGQQDGAGRSAMFLRRWPPKTGKCQQRALPVKLTWPGLHRSNPWREHNHTILRVADPPGACVSTALVQVAGFSATWPRKAAATSAQAT
jgi:hypothetical protein